MWSMWDAPSDRDYYGDYEEPAAEVLCDGCGAGELEACEPWCLANLVEGTESEEIRMPVASELPASVEVPGVA